VYRPSIQCQERAADCANDGGTFVSPYCELDKRPQRQVNGFGRHGGLVLLLVTCCLVGIASEAYSQGPCRPPLTDQEKQICIQEGRTLAFPPPSSGHETAAARAARTVQAAWLTDLAKGPGRVVQVPVVITNAIIHGPLVMQYCTFSYFLEIVGSEFDGPVDFSFATFTRHAAFVASKFDQDANFRAAHAVGGLALMLADFEGPAVFQDVELEQLLDASGAVFHDVNFQGMTAKREVFFRTSFTGAPTRFLGVAQFDAAHIQIGAEFDGAQFASRATFEGMQVDGHAFFRSDAQGRRVHFGGKASLAGAHVLGYAEFTGAEFEQAVDFSNAEIDGPAMFRMDAEGNDVTFRGEAKFIDFHAHGTATFNGAQFATTASSDRARFDDAAYFRPDDKGRAVQFAAGARFLNVRIGNQAGFQRAVFRGMVAFSEAQFEQGVDFSGADFSGIAVFDEAEFKADASFRPEMGEPVRFRGEAHFVAAHFDGPAEFNGAQFEQVANFSSVRFDRPTFFRLSQYAGENIPVRFGGPATFSGAQFGADTEFTGAEFRQGATFQNAHFSDVAHLSRVHFFGVRLANFGGAHFERDLLLDGAHSEGPLEFVGTIADGEVVFLGASFAGRVSLLDAHFHTVNFRSHTTETVPPGERLQFGGAVDLRGFTYERISVAWGEMLSKMSPYDREAYGLLEKVMRASGDDDAADKVHLEQQREERWHEWQGRDFAGWLSSRAWGLFANYGIRPYRLLGFSLALLLWGTWVFSRPGAIEIAATLGNSAADDNPVTETRKEGTLRVVRWYTLSGDGFRLALRYFAPVELPLPADLKPSDRRCFLLRCSSWAAVLKVLGWILVPLGIAALAGFLRYAPH
jgi:uncharacterized protein YjbI with pentapeptide repeats